MAGIVHFYSLGPKNKQIFSTLVIHIMKSLFCLKSDPGIPVLCLTTCDTHSHRTAPSTDRNTNRLLTLWSLWARINRNAGPCDRSCAITTKGRLLKPEGNLELEMWGIKHAAPSQQTPQLTAGGATALKVAPAFPTSQILALYRERHEGRTVPALSPRT